MVVGVSLSSYSETIFDKSLQRDGRVEIRPKGEVGYSSLTWVVSAVNVY
jgi:hypothetical protein